MRHQRRVRGRLGLQVLLEEGPARQHPGPGVIGRGPALRHLAGGGVGEEQRQVLIAQHGGAQLGKRVARHLAARGDVPQRPVEELDVLLRL